MHASIVILLNNLYFAALHKPILNRFRRLVQVNQLVCILCIINSTITTFSGSFIKGKKITLSRLTQLNLNAMWAKIRGQTCNNNFVILCQHKFTLSLKYRSSSKTHCKKSFLTFIKVTPVK